MRVSYLLDIINSVFKLPTCRRNLDKPSKRACIEGEMGRCSMPCTRLVSQQEYNNQISEAIEFLNGKTSNVKKLLKLKMQNFIDKQDFENAIIIRDYLTLIEKIEEKVLTNLPKNADLDLFAYIDNPIRSVIVQFIRGGKMTGQEVYTFEDKEGSDDELFSSFLAQFYKSKQQVPKLILLNRPATYFSKFLQDVINSNAKISCPVKGVKKHLIDNAIIVGQKYLAQNKLKIAQKNKNTQGALDDLAQILGLNKKIWRIECYDISNTFGTNSVASMVVFEGGVPAKKEYRKFKIKTVEGANDFASIAEVMTRRFSHDQSFGATPDLVVIDGGLGQLHAAVNAISKLNVKLEVISLAKKEELIFSTKSNNPIALLKSEPALKLLQRLRDEAHRFAIGYHRTLRQKSMLR